ncbi:MAG: nuclear transport factor 2 family protein [Acidobacteria bacterium]|nr:nuclear transport factor 2 family protein [Acidobacteriota bacterium]
MKRCPTCQSTYTDDSLSFCLTDGAALVDTSFNPQATLPNEFQGTLRDENRATLPDDIQVTLRYPPQRLTSEPPTTVPHAQTPHGNWNPSGWTPSPQAVSSARQRNSTPWVIGGIVVLLLGAAIAVWAIIASRKSSDEAMEPVKRKVVSNNNQQVANTNSNQSPQSNNANQSTAQAPIDTDIPPTDPDLVLSQLTAVEHEWNDANIKGNRATVRRIVADEFRGVGANGSVENKEQMLANLEPNPDIVSLKLSDLKISLAGNTAVLTGLNTAKGRNGQTITFRFTDTFLWRDGHWQAISSQATQVK